ncbi:hypothetical protein L596_026236 [Steinernema carpocapsae]|uniref:ShKT domain-containing protein n=1 Tax=Steinernema carpocapsae TaxID=34508 RepID=A0A4U5M0R3_STECR|nr:hypothetical protein L596_026236 [Steinernema carpocapsae]
MKILAVLLLCLFVTVQATRRSKRYPGAEDVDVYGRYPGYDYEVYNNNHKSNMYPIWWLWKKCCGEYIHATKDCPNICS